MPDSVLSPGFKLQSQRSILNEDKDKLKELVLGSQYLSGAPPPPRPVPHTPPLAAGARPPLSADRIAPQVLVSSICSCKPGAHLDGYRRAPERVRPRPRGEPSASICARAAGSITRPPTPPPLPAPCGADRPTRLQHQHRHGAARHSSAHLATWHFSVISPTPGLNRARQPRYALPTPRSKRSARSLFIYGGVLPRLESGENTAWGDAMLACESYPDAPADTRRPTAAAAAAAGTGEKQSFDHNLVLKAGPDRHCLPRHRNPFCTLVS
jgi:hypothetical protein